MAGLKKNLKQMEKRGGKATGSFLSLTMLGNNKGGHTKC